MLNYEDVELAVEIFDFILSGSWDLTISGLTAATWISGYRKVKKIFFGPKPIAYINLLTL